MKMKLLILFTIILASAYAYKNPNYADQRTTMVHLFEWKFEDIAKECERFLGPMGYAGVQVSPINENLIIANRPWYERYQPMSYKILTRSGDVKAFKNMIDRCNKVGVRIYVDVVINHMTGDQSPAIGTANSNAVTNERKYPEVPYGPEDFHQLCSIQNYNNAAEVRNCELSGLHDLDQSKEHVRKAILAFLNEIIDYGVAGFRVDAAKHMWPQDLTVIYGQLKNLSTEHGFASKTRPYIYQEVIDLGGEAVSKMEYNNIGAVIEFQYGIVLGNMFRSNDDLRRLYNWGVPEAWRLLPSEDALVMVDNHDNQRGHGAGGASILTYQKPKEYKMAVAFMLAHPYGYPRVMSSFAFSNPSMGPPNDADENIISPNITSNGLCDKNWVCEHRWHQIASMVTFRNVVQNSKLENWWAGSKDQIAFSRSSLGFVAFNAGKENLKYNLITGLSAGQYCDVISGTINNGRCTGKTITVDSNGKANIEIRSEAEDGVIAIHVKAKL